MVKALGSTIPKAPFLWDSKHQTMAGSDQQITEPPNCPVVCRWVTDMASLECTNGIPGSTRYRVGGQRLGGFNFQLVTTKKLGDGTSDGFSDQWFLGTSSVKLMADGFNRLKKWSQDIRGIRPMRMGILFPTVMHCMPNVYTQRPRTCWKGGERHPLASQILIVTGWFSNHRQLCKILYTHELDIHCGNSIVGIVCF